MGSMEDLLDCTSLQPQDSKAVEDERRFHIYIQMNNKEPILINNLRLGEYLKFKHNDNFLIEYCKSNYLEEEEELEKLFRSLDDVDYTLIDIESDSKGKERVQCTKTNINRVAVIPIETKDMCNISTDNNIFELDSEASSSSSINGNEINLQEDSKASPIWKHVQKLKAKSSLKCLYCQKEYKDCGNTTNMLKHLKNQHPFFFKPSKENKIKDALKRQKGKLNLEPPKPKKVKQATPTQESQGIVDAFQRINSFKDGGCMSSKISSTILYMICKDMLPMSIVEFEGFTTQLKLLAPLYKPPSKKTIARKLEARYDIMKGRFIEELNTIDNYCITVDIWTDCTSQSYLGLTIHYLNNNFKMESRYISCLPLYERHTSENLKTSMQNIFKEFKIIEKKITAIVSDGEAAIKKACIDICGRNKHLVCIAHVVAHLLPDALKNLPDLQEMIERIKSIVRLMKRSIPASDKLKQLQIEDGKNDSNVLKLKQDVPTRWTSKVNMLQRYIELEKYLYVAMNECDSPLDLMNREEMKILKEALLIMEPINTVITEISGDKYPTASLIIPIIHCLERKLESINPSTEIGIKLKNCVQVAMLERFKFVELSEILATSTILDPRYKKIHFKDGLAYSKALTRIRCAIQVSKTSESKKSESINGIPKNTSSIWDYHDAVLENSVCFTEATDNNVELDQYLKLPLISRQEDIFLYWKNVALSFPILSKYAISHLPVIATSVPSERIFSKAGNTKRDRRNRISGKSLNMLLFLGFFSKDHWFSNF